MCPFRTSWSTVRWSPLRCPSKPVWRTEPCSGPLQNRFTPSSRSPKHKVLPTPLDAVEELTGQAMANLARASAHMLLRKKASSAVLQGRSDRPGPQGAANALREAAKTAEADLPSAEELAAAAIRSVM
eukprot:s7334_g1.t1